MKITIDTKQDHPSEIEHAIKLLSALLNKKNKYSNIGNYSDSNYNSQNQKDVFSSDNNSPGGFASMFGDDSNSNLDSNNYEKDYETYGSNDKEESNQNFTIKPY